MEAMQIIQTDLNSSDMVEWTLEHVSASVSLCSNMAKHTAPVGLISKGDTKELVARMVEHLQTISAAAEANLRED